MILLLVRHVISTLVAVLRLPDLRIARLVVEDVDCASALSVGQVDEEGLLSRKLHGHALEEVEEGEEAVLSIYALGAVALLGTLIALVQRVE